MKILAVDTGGTFTDLAAFDASERRVVYGKSLTTYHDLAEGIFAAIGKGKLPLSGEGVFKHGTTLVINALLQRSADRVALVTTKGFRDVLEMARGNRPAPFDLFYQRNPPLIPRELRFEIDERIDATGAPLIAPARADVERLVPLLKAAGIASIAVAFVNSYVSETHEQRVAAWLRELMPDAFVTCSTDLTREWYEYERTATAAANAYVGPQMSGYVGRLDAKLRQQDFAGQFYMMGSNGGVLSLERAMREPISLIESGPVGGCIGAAAYARELGMKNVLAFDMGGTTAKCALVQDGQFEVKPVYHVGGYEFGFPVRGAVVDIVEVSAGGGSIAWLDESGRLSVGPKSAGSTPGPACYGRGGTEPTITDANVVLGRLAPEAFLGGELELDLDAARTAISDRIAKPFGLDSDDGLDRMAAGMISIATVIMAGSIRRVSVERGRDPRDYTLFAYGGGGPLHAVDLARELHIPNVIIPPEPGNFCALGMLLADVRRDRSETFLQPLKGGIEPALEARFKTLESSLSKELALEAGTQQITIERFAEMRYRGQVHSLLTPLTAGADAASMRKVFEELYQTRYGHVEATNPVEIVNLRASGRASVAKPDLSGLWHPPASGEVPVRERMVYFAATGSRLPTRVYTRGQLPSGFAAAGPALVEEYGSTTLIGPKDRFFIGQLGEIHIAVEPV